MPKQRSKSARRGWWVYERRVDQLAPRTVYIKRLLGSLAIALAVIIVGLIIGIAGYHYFAGFGWIDSLLEASMILGGMGPVNQLPNDHAKIFASIFALFSGLVVLALMGIMLSPVVHRVLHRFHVDEKDVD
jgi:flagellar biosynthesis protein FliR